MQGGTRGRYSERYRDGTTGAALWRMRKPERSNRACGAGTYTCDEFKGRTLRVARRRAALYYADEETSRQRPLPPTHPHMTASQQATSEGRSDPPDLSNSLSLSHSHHASSHTWAATPQNNDTREGLAHTCSSTHHASQPQLTTTYVGSAALATSMLGDRAATV